MIYDYKSDETIQDVITECLCPIIEDLVDEYSMLHRNDSLIIYAPSYIAREILVRFLEETEETWINEYSCNALLDNDNNEVIITIACDGMLFVETARGTNGKLKVSDASLSYVYDSFSKNDIDYLSYNGDSILIFGLEDECEEDINDRNKLDQPGKSVEYSKDNSGNLHGFTVSKSDGNSWTSYSVYTTDKLSKADIQSLLQEAGF